MHTFIGKFLALATGEYLNTKISIPRLRSGTTLAFSFLWPLVMTVILLTILNETPLSLLFSALHPIIYTVVVNGIIFGPSYICIALGTEALRTRLTNAVLFTIIAIPYGIALWFLSMAISCFFGNCL